MFRPNLLPVLAGALLLSGASASMAQEAGQESEVAILRRQINEMNERLQKLEAAEKSAQPVATPAPAPAPMVQSASKTPIVFSGLMQVQGNAYFDQDDRPTGSAKLADTTRLRRGEIRIAMPAITPKLSGLVMFDVAKTNNLNRSGSPLQDLVIAYKADTNPKAPKTIEVGQFKPGFGFESDLVSTADLALTERSQIYSFRDLAVLANNPLLPGLAGGGLGDNRDSGIRLSGSVPQHKINYNIGVFNGIGEDQNDIARGDVKAMVGRIFYGHRDSKNTLRGSIFGVSALTGNN
ncbi:hypothetical protein EON80_20030, partial [bacterium]